MATTEPEGGRGGGYRAQALRLRFVARPVFRRERVVVDRIAGVTGSSADVVGLPDDLRAWHAEYARMAEKLPRERLAPGSPDAVARQIGLCLSEFLVHGRLVDPRGVDLVRFDRCRERLAMRVEEALGLQGTHRAGLAERAAVWLRGIDARRREIVRSLQARDAVDPRRELARRVALQVTPYRAIGEGRSAVAVRPSTLDAIGGELEALVEVARDVVPERVGELEARRERVRAHAARSREARSGTTLDELRAALALELDGLERAARMRYGQPRKRSGGGDVGRRLVDVRHQVFRLVELERQLWSLARAFEGSGVIPLLRRLHDLEVRLTGVWTRAMRPHLGARGVQGAVDR